MRDIAHERDEALLEVQELKERVRELERIFDAERQARTDDTGKYLKQMEVKQARVRELESEVDILRASRDASDTRAKDMRRVVEAVRDVLESSLDWGISSYNFDAAKSIRNSLIARSLLASPTPAKEDSDD